LCDIGGLQLRLRIGGLIVHRAVVEKIPLRAGLDREVDILGDIASRLDELQRVELRCNHACDLAGSGPPAAQFAKAPVFSLV